MLKLVLKNCLQTMCEKTAEIEPFKSNFQFSEIYKFIMRGSLNSSMIKVKKKPRSNFEAFDQY